MGNAKNAEMTEHAQSNALIASDAILLTSRVDAGMYKSSAVILLAMKPRGLQSVERKQAVMTTALLFLLMLHLIPVRETVLLSLFATRPHLRVLLGPPVLRQE